MNKALTYQEALDFAMENYSKGGDTFWECTSREEFEALGPVTKTDLLKVFNYNDAVYRDMTNSGR